MIRIFKKHVYLCAITTSIFSFLQTAEVYAKTSNELKACDENALLYQCSDGKNHIIKSKTYKTTDLSPYTREGRSFAVMVQGQNTVVRSKKMDVSSAISDDKKKSIYEYGISVSKGGQVFLNDSSIENMYTGIDVEDQGKLWMKGGVIDSSIGVSVDGEESSVMLTNTKIYVSKNGYGLYGYDSAKINMIGGIIDAVDASGLYVDEKANITLSSVEIISYMKNEKDSHGKMGSMNIGRDATLNLKNVRVNVKNTNGIWIDSSGWVDSSLVGDNHRKDSKQRTIALGNNSLTEIRELYLTGIEIEDTIIKVEGDKPYYGMYFDKIITADDEYEAKKEKQEFYLLGNVNFIRSTLKVPDGTAIYSNARRYTNINVSQGSDISGNVLLQAENSSSIMLTADASLLKGSTHVSDTGTVVFSLTNGSEWTLTGRNKKDSKHVSSTDLYTSSISEVSLRDSSIIFEKGTHESYQTLNIGKGILSKSRNVYSAEGNARIYLNTYLNNDGSFREQQTDRLLIHGDVSGKTTVYVHPVKENSEKNTDKDNKNQSISIIQVSGNAQEDSFKLYGDYITLNGAPYQYRLKAYNSKDNNTSQRFVEGTGNFWDFRLETAFIDSKNPSSSLQRKKRFAELKVSDIKAVPASRSRRGKRSTESQVIVRETVSAPPIVSDVMIVVPQVPTYLLMPNALFHAGLMDVSNQNKRLESMRIAPDEFFKKDEISVLLVRGYGGSHHYISNLTDFEYGYGADLGYSALEASTLLKAVESKYGTASFGLIGTYGRLSLQPNEVKNSQKSVFDKWSATAYVSMKRDNDFYVDGLLSYGLFKGDVSTLARGKTASLKSNPISASLIAGQVFTTRSTGIVFDPQVHLIYQRLLFDKANDVDGFDIEIGSPDKWVARVGGSLRQSLTKAEKEQVVSVYSKLYFIHSFFGKQSMHLKDTFKLGDFGSSLEAGLGFNVQLSEQIVFHGDLTYQHKLTEAGFSGTSFSGEVRYSF